MTTAARAVRPEDAPLVYQLLGRKVSDQGIAQTLQVPVEALHGFYRNQLELRLGSRQVDRDAISAQEGRVISLMVQGMTYKQVADSLGIATDTVRTYMRSVFNKTGFANKTQLALWAKENGY